MTIQSPDDEAHARHPIRVVANRTGLTPSALRAWERRYGTVDPGRSEGGQRLYSDRDIEKLALLKRITDAGRSIGDVAHLSLEEVREVAREDAAARRRLGAPPPGSDPAEIPPGPGDFLVPALEAVSSMDAEGLEAVLRRGMLVLPGEVFTDRVLAPLMVEIGERWARGELRPSHEHMASAVVRRILDWMTVPAGEADGPSIVVGTLAGEEHEIGALLAATTAALAGWSVTYLGQGLPHEELVAAADAVGARAVGVSVVHGHEGAGAALGALRRRLDPDVVLMVGGRTGPEAVSRAEVDGLTLVRDLPAFRKALQALE